MYFIGATRYFFSPNCLLATNLISVHNHIDKHRTDHESLLEENKLFLAKFLYIINQKANKWMEDCKNKDKRCLVNDNIINFQPILDQVVLRQFYATLPVSIREVINKGDKLSCIRPGFEETKTRSRHRSKQSPE